MKKFTAFLLSFLMILSAVTLSACGGKEEASSEASTEATEAETTETTAEAESTEGSSSEESVFTPDYSKYLTDDGLIEGVRALDVVKIPDFSEFYYAESELAPDEDTIDLNVNAFLQTLEKEEITDPSYAIQDGDTLNIDYVGSVDGVEFEGGSTNGAGTEVTIGVTSYIEGFLEQLIGHHTGDEFDIDVTFPDPYPNNDDLSGKPAVFHIIINNIYKTPELTDELVAQHPEEVAAYFYADGLDTVEKIRQYVYDHIRNQNLEDAISEDLSIMGIPDIKEENMPANALAFSKNLSEITLYNYYGMTMEEFIEAYDYEGDELDQIAYTDACNYLLVQAIAEQEGFEARQEDIILLAGAADLNEILNYYGRGYLARYVLEDKAYEYMRNHVTIE